MKILLIGDSFAASTAAESWVNLLMHDVVNLSSCGSSEYRIIRKLLDSDIKNFDHVIVVHTSPYRIYTEFNPLHQHSETHRDCDLLYQDVKHKVGDDFADNVCWWFENIFDLSQAQLTHQLLIKHSMDQLASVPNTHVTFFQDTGTQGVHDLSHIYTDHPGAINHMDETGNQLVADYMRGIL